MNRTSQLYSIRTSQGVECLPIIVVLVQFAPLLLLVGEVGKRPPTAYGVYFDAICGAQL